MALVAVASILMISAGDVGAQPASENGPSFKTGTDEEFAPGKVIVKFEEDATRAEKADARVDEGLQKKEELGLIDAEVNAVRGQSVEQAVRDLERRPDVDYAEPDFLLKPSQTTSANDTDYPEMYGLNNTGQAGGTTDADVDAPEAWNTTTGDAGTVVAVVDTGVDISHPDLKNNIWTNPGEVAGNKVDDDGNGYVDDVNGYDFYSNDASVYDPDPVSGGGDEHGTHVAGTIAAEGNNSLGVTGVSWRASIMPVKFLGPNGGFTSDAVEAINYAVKNDAKISNNSWGGGGYSQALRDAIANADASGHLFVAAAGNGGADGVGDDSDVTPSYPASYDLPNIISVAATDRNDNLAGFSNFGAKSVDVAAPGVSILSTLPGNAYGSYSGTSMATPHVSGVAALIMSQRPELDDAQIKAQILQFVEKKGSLSGKTVTGGRTNAAASLTGQAEPLQDDTTPNTGISSGPSGTVRSNSASFSFTASEPSKFRCSLDGAAFSECASPESYSSLASRSHTLRVAAVDSAGNVDPTPATRTWTVDTIAPDTGISSGPSGTVRSNSASFAFTASEAGTFRCSLDGAAFSACASPKSYSALASRVHTFRVATVDRAGNVDPTPATRTWTVDTVLPTVTGFAPASSGKTRDRTPAISAVARDSQTNLAKGNIRLFVDGRQIAASAFSYNGSTDKLSYTSRILSYARHTVRVEARDAAGNVVNRQWRFSVVR